MLAKTWVPGTDSELDTLFDSLRDIQFNNKSHRLSKNYSVDHFKNTIAHTICFDNTTPIICSSISSRDCWPIGAYRILNRTWKPNDKQQIMKEISQAMGKATLSQIDWLQKNIDFKLYFISRQTNNWMEWVTKNFKRQFNLDFQIAKNKYLTCPNECDESCWQNIIYNGDEELLKSWKSK